VRFSGVAAGNEYTRRAAVKMAAWSGSGTPLPARPDYSIPHIRYGLGNAAVRCDSLNLLLMHYERWVSVDDALRLVDREAFRDWLMLYRKN
jgi:hypothetical protein